MDNAYKKVYNEYPLLSASEEFELISRAKAGSKEDFDKVILSNIRLVEKTIQKYRYRELSDEELMQEGLTGLIMALHKFDLKVEARFSTYAVFWIEHVVRSSINSARLIKMSYKSRKALKEIGNYINSNGFASYDDIAQKLDISVDEVKVLINFLDVTLSLDYVYGEEEDSTMYKYIQQRSPYEEVISRLTVDKILLSANLKDQEMDVAKALFINDIPASEYAQIIGLSRQRIYAVRERAIEKIKKVYR